MSRSIISQYLKQVDNRWRLTIEQLSLVITTWYPDLQIKIWSSMGYEILGWGQTTYRLSSGKVNQWFILGLADHKRYCSLYVWGWENQQSLIERYQSKLGRVKIGKACINFNSLDDLDLEGLKLLADRAVSLS